MLSRLSDLVGRWADAVGIDPAACPAAEALDAAFGPPGRACRPPVDAEPIGAWQERYGFELPPGLRAWLRLSNGLYHGGPLVHPLTSLGPMVPFARLPDLLVQPESWFELGNPHTESICIDLAYAWPGGCCPVFTSGDDQRSSRPRIIAPSFETWFLRLLHEGGREYWFDAGYAPLGEPWLEHRRWTPQPPLPRRLRPLADRVRPLMHPGADDRVIAEGLGISRADLEAIFRFLQHALPEGSTQPQ